MALDMETHKVESLWQPPPDTLAKLVAKREELLAQLSPEGRERFEQAEREFEQLVLFGERRG